MHFADLGHLRVGQKSRARTPGLRVLQQPREPVAVGLEVERPGLREGVVLRGQGRDLGVEELDGLELLFDSRATAWVRVDDFGDAVGWRCGAGDVGDAGVCDLGRGGGGGAAALGAGLHGRHDGAGGKCVGDVCVEMVG